MFLDLQKRNSQQEKKQNPQHALEKPLRVSVKKYQPRKQKTEGIARGGLLRVRPGSGEPVTNVIVGF